MYGKRINVPFTRQPDHPLPAVMVLGLRLFGACGALGKGLCRALEQGTSPLTLPLLTTLLLPLLLQHMQPLWGTNRAWGVPLWPVPWAGSCLQPALGSVPPHRARE